MAVTQAGNIIIGAGDARQVNIIAMFEIMTAAAGGKGQCRPAKVQRTGQWHPVKQQVDPVQRPHPAEPGCPPALAFRPGEFRQDRCHHLWQQVGGCGAGLFDMGKQEGAFRRVLCGQLVTGEPGGFQETLNGLVRRIGARPAAFLGQIRLPVRQPLDIKSEMTRRDEMPDIGAVDIKACLCQLALHHVLQVPRSRNLHAGRNFLGNQFQQKISHYLPPFRRRSTPRNSRAPAPAPARYRRRVR